MSTRVHVAWCCHPNRALITLALCISLLPPFGVCDELIFVQVVHRHGDRGPITIAPGFAEEWESLGVIAGQLTTIGVAQQKAFGTYLRSSYGELLGLSDTYVPSEISVRATESDRTIGSAYSLLRGLYPDHEVPIPVYTVREGEDFESRFWSNCPSWFAWMEGIEDLMGPVVVNELDLDLLNQRLQFDVGSMSKTHLLGSIYDNLECMDAHGLDTRFMSAGKRHNITMMAKRVWYAKYVGAYKANTRGPAAQELIRAFAKNARAVVDGTATQKIKFYSAHDTTLVGLHDALGLFYEHDNKSNFLLPGYSNSIIFELRNESGRYSLRIKRGRPEKGASNTAMDWTYSAQDLGVISNPQKNYSYSPYLDPWLEYVDNLPTYEEGCCLQEEDFTRRQCATSPDNTDHSHDIVCRKYQEYCPLSACGDGSVFSQPLDKCISLEAPTTDPTTAPKPDTPAPAPEPVAPAPAPAPSQANKEDAVSLRNTIKALGAALVITILGLICLGVYAIRRLRYRGFAGLEGLEDTDASPDNEAEDIGIIDSGNGAFMPPEQLEKVALTTVPS